MSLRALIGLVEDENVKKILEELDRTRLSTEDTLDLIQNTDFGFSQTANNDGEDIVRLEPRPEVAVIPGEPDVEGG